MVAPMALDGPLNGDAFQAYVEQVLVPELAQQHVMMDNLGSHKDAAVRRTIETVGTRLLFLPRYGPDLNPIENAFAKLNASLRSVIGALLSAFAPSECANYFAAAGYDAARPNSGRQRLGDVATDRDIAQGGRPPFRRPLPPPLPRRRSSYRASASVFR